MKWLYRLGSLCAVFAVTLSFMIVPASAETLDRSMSVEFNRGGNLSSFTFDTPLYDSYTNNHPGNKVSNPVVGTKYYASLQSVNTDTEFLYESAVGLYVSWFMYASTRGTGAWSYQNAVYDGFYTNMYGAQGTIFDLEHDTFTPHTDLKNPSMGYTYKAQFLGTPELPISALGIMRRSGSAAQMYFVHDTVETGTNQDTSTIFGICVPSARMIGRESTAELDALESMADAIAAQSEILSAMYGEVIAVCNAIYERTGDMLAAQNLANSYFAQILTVLNNTNSITNDIYNLLSTQFQLLISTIESESFEIQEVLKGESEAIQDCINDAVDRLIEYFDGIFVPKQETEQGHASTNESIGAVGDYESSTQESIGSIIEQLPSADFSGGLVDGLASILALFSAVWSALSPLHPFFYFCWLFGILLVVIGRKDKSED